MTQKIFHITWTILGLALLVFLVISSIAIIKATDTLSEAQTTLESFKREDFIRTLDVIEQQVQNDAVKYEAQLEHWKNLNWGWSEEKWKGFLAYCTKNGYETNDENWEKYINFQLPN